jgi:hypothetical protein
MLSLLYVAKAALGWLCNILLRADGYPRRGERNTQRGPVVNRLACLAGAYESNAKLQCYMTRFLVH